MLHEESEIIRELEKGNENCLNMLFDNYYRALCVYGLRFVWDVDDVEDIVQEVFISFWMNKRRTVFKGSVRSYLFGAVAKAASGLAVRKGKMVFDDVEDYVDCFLDELGEYDEHHFAQLRDKINARVEALPEKTKQIFKAIVLEGLTYPQVGKQFGITVNTVKTMYYRALKQLKKELGADALIVFLIFLKASDTTTRCPVTQG